VIALVIADKRLFFWISLSARAWIAASV